MVHLHIFSLRLPSVKIDVVPHPPCDSTLRCEASVKNCRLSSCERAHVEQVYIIQKTLREYILDEDSSILPGAEILT